MTTELEQQEQKIFENEARRIARELWPQAQYDGAAMADGRERDGVFVTEECVHLLEATVSRSKTKAQDDIAKMIKLARKLRAQYTDKASQCWFVTKSEPTAEQREVANKHHGEVIALSFAQFQTKIVNAALYLQLRDNYPFGSVRDPTTGETKAAIEYVPTDLLQVGQEQVWSVSDIRRGLLAGRKVTVLGDYGAGKSMTLREVYKGMRGDYLGNKTGLFPIYLNLRDHIGQTNAAEVLERHGRNIGFSNPPHLVRAWRAGYVVMLLDGFDELTTLGIQGLWKQLQESRFRAMEVVREFVKSQPVGAGVIISGRAHFFDSEKERRKALLTPANAVELTLNEFNDEQIKKYLIRSGFSGVVPSWMPSRPLLVAYLAGGLLNELPLGSQGDEKADPARGWDALVDRVCAREAEIEPGIDGPTVRRILERLATKCRYGESGVGPISWERITSAFVEICGYQPDEKGQLLLQRLPGLGIDRADEGTRVFIDEDLVDVCRAGDVVRFIESPYGNAPDPFRSAEFGLGALGISVAVIHGRALGLECGKLNAGLKLPKDHRDLGMLTLDVARVTLESGCAISELIQIQGVLIPSLELYQGVRDCSHITFRECYFYRIELDADLPNSGLPHFEKCYFGEVDGRASQRDLPKGVFDEECEFDKFSQTSETSNAIGSMNLPLGTRVLLIVLRKLFVQSGGGRKENALHRGLDGNARRLVDQVLRLLQAGGFISPYKRAGLDMKIWLPDRGKAGRVKSILASPHDSTDPLVQEAANLS